MSVYPLGADVRRDARFSTDGRYRYALWRDWCGMERPRWATFIMLNPSTADADLDDPTIRRCVTFARTVQATGLTVVNLYAYRATAPEDLWRADDPIGPDGDATLAEFLSMAARHGGPVIAGWGAHAKRDRVDRVVELAREAGASLCALGLTKDGQPRHPLYMPAAARPVVFL